MKTHITSKKDLDKMSVDELVKLFTDIFEEMLASVDYNHDMFPEDEIHEQN